MKRTALNVLERLVRAIYSASIVDNISTTPTIDANTSVVGVIKGNASLYVYIAETTVEIMPHTSMATTKFLFLTESDWLLFRTLTHAPQTPSTLKRDVKPIAKPAKSPK